MKKVFESKYGTEVEALKKHLEDKCFESQIHETFENFELLVDENIYDEVLTEINGMKTVWKCHCRQKTCPGKKAQSI